LPPGCWLRLVSNEIDLKVLQLCKSTRGLHPRPSVVARNTGCIGDYNVQHLCAEPLWRAAQTINKSYWAGFYYRQQRDKEATYQAAVRSLAFKWVRILNRCWQTSVAYDGSRYLKALERHGSPLLKRQPMIEAA
jgi:hypothetical protein